MRPTATLISVLLVVLAVVFAHAGGTPFDTGFTALQIIFTGPSIVSSLIAIVIGGYQFAHGEPGAKKASRGRLASGTVQ